MDAGKYAAARRLHTNRWTVKVMIAIAMMCVTQAYAYWKQTKGEQGRYPHYKFVRELMNLMFDFDEKKYLARYARMSIGWAPEPPSDNQLAPRHKGKHCMVALPDGERRVCRVCSDRRRDDDQKSPMKANFRQNSRDYYCRYYCPGCDDAPMHPECFTRVGAHHCPGNLAHGDTRSQVAKVSPSPNSGRKKTCRAAL
jgi:hypothetical protein